MTLPTKKFTAAKLKLTKIYENINAEGYYSSPLQTAKTKEIYGELLLPPSFSKRPRLLGCFVSSIDGALAFKDDPSSTLLAQKNEFDPAGAKADFWLLNFLRANCQGVILGPQTLQAEPNLTAHLHDQDLVSARRNLLAEPPVPLNIVVSRQGKSIPYGHLLFSHPEVPTLIATSPQGGEQAAENMEASFTRINLRSDYQSKVLDRVDQNLAQKQTIILVTGQQGELNDRLLFKFLRDYQVERILVEAPTYAHYLIRAGLLDELFLNQSGVYSGGAKYLNDNPQAAFASENAPPVKMLSIHQHSSCFFYYRYRFLYSNKS